MKKLITLIFVMILTISFVSATFNNNSKNTKNSAEQVIRVETRNEEIIKNNHKIQGIENALNKIKNEDVKNKLSNNLEMLRTHLGKRHSLYENITIENVDNETGTVKLKAKEKVKFLGFISGRATKRFNVNEEGAVEEYNPWYRLLYIKKKMDVSDEEINETEEEEEEPYILDERCKEVKCPYVFWDEELKKCVCPTLGEKN